MRRIVATMLITASLGAGAASAGDECGPGCHNAVNGGCVVNGWEAGAPVRNECPAGAHPTPPCSEHYVWRKHAKACVPAN
jgi:hypothetical protein